MEIIDTYTRQNAIDDGYQFELDKEITRDAGFTIPVFITSGVHDIIERAVSNERWCNDYTGVIWDILTVLRFQIARSTGRTRTATFTVKITGAGRRQNFNFLSIVGPYDVDRPEPAITIMLPEEY